MYHTSKVRDSTCREIRPRGQRLAAPAAKFKGPEAGGPSSGQSVPSAHNKFWSQVGKRMPNVLV